MHQMFDVLVTHGAHIAVGLRDNQSWLQGSDSLLVEAIQSRGLRGPRIDLSVDVATGLVAVDSRVGHPREFFYRGRKVTLMTDCSNAFREVEPK